MKKSFLKGLLAGVGGSLLIVVIIWTVVFIKMDPETDDGKSNTKIEANAGDESKKEKQDYNKIVAKLAFLEELVDDFYLKDVNPDTYADWIYKGFMGSLEDPYSTYYTKEEYTSLQESSSGVYCGIGAYVSQDAKTGVITIVKPFETGPAHKAGILPGDVIYKVEGKEVTGLDLTEVVSRMKGKEGTKVKLTVIRKEKPKPIDFTLTRKEVEVPTIEYEMMDSKIGYILISEFDEITVTQFKDAVNKLEADGMKGLVVDVRDNPGGLLDAVVKILDRLLPKGLIVYTEDKYGNREEEKAKDSKKIEVPLAVLINGNSASASEIFAGAVQDYKIGTIVGTTSFGKGIVQRIFPLKDGSAVKLTISKYFTPKGRNIHGTGIEPDVTVELSEELLQQISIPKDKDNQLQEAIKQIKKEIK